MKMECTESIKQNNCADTPLVSLILPVYNVSRYLSVCLDSILAQTYANFEAILIDDGSTDDSLQICQEYEKKDRRFRVIHQDNQGLASARNTGLRNRRGEYFYFIDSDDCIHPQLLEIVVSIAETEHANLVQINLKDVPADYQSFIKEADILIKQATLQNVIQGNQAAIRQNQFSTQKTLQQDVDAAKNQSQKNSRLDFVNTYHAVQDKLQHFSLVSSLYNLDRDNQKLAKDIRLTTTVVWTKLYRSSTFSEFLFPEGMRMHEDQMVAHRILKTGGGMVFLDLPLYFYRQSDASLIRVGWTPKRLAILDCYEDRLTCCEEVRDDVIHGEDTLQIQNAAFGKQEKEVGNVSSSLDNLPGSEKKSAAESQALVNYIYERYLVCCFRNYDMVNRNMKGEEKKQQQKAILQRMKTLLSGRRGKLGKGKTIFFNVFLLMPELFITVFDLRNKIFKK